MAIFLVDLQFREKAKNFLTSKEVFFVVFCLFLAMIPWIDIYNFVYTGKSFSEARNICRTCCTKIVLTVKTEQKQKFVYTKCSAGILSLQFS